jgi:hypothetical protein
MGENGDRERVAIALWDCEHGEPWPPANDLTRDVYLARAGRAIAALRATPAPTGSLAEVIDEIRWFIERADNVEEVQMLRLRPSITRLRKWRRALLSVGSPEPVTQERKANEDTRTWAEVEADDLRARMHEIADILWPGDREWAEQPPKPAHIVATIRDRLRSPESTRSWPGETETLCDECGHPASEHLPDGCVGLVEVSEHGVSWDEMCGCAAFRSGPDVPVESETEGKP